MTEKASELEAAIRMRMEERRAEVGPEPTVDQLLAFHRGEFSAEERARMEERLAHYPDAALLLAVFTADREPQPGDPDYVSPEQQDVALKKLRQRLEQSGDLLPTEDPDPSPLQERIPVPTEVFRAKPRVVPRWRWLERTAAVFLIVSLGALWYARGDRIETLSEQVAELQEPSVIQRETRLNPDPRLRSSGRHVTPLPRRSEPYHLTLLFRGETYPGYRLEIVPVDPAADEPIWSRDGLEASADQAIELLLPGGFLPSGAHQVRLYGTSEAGRDRLVAVYSIEV